MKFSCLQSICGNITEAFLRLCVQLQWNYEEKVLLHFDSRRQGGPSPTFLPLEKLVVRMINVLLMRPCLFNHLRARGIHVSIYS